jgi:hypothetical protein
VRVLAEEKWPRVGRVVREGVVLFVPEAAAKQAPPAPTQINPAMPGALKRSPLKRPGTVSRTDSISNFDELLSERPYLALGLEGSANKLGAGIIKHDSDGSTAVLSNVRHTYITPPGEGFLPQDTARHHRQWIHSVIKDSLKQAGVGIQDLDCICFTKGIS